MKPWTISLILPVCLLCATCLLPTAAKAGDTGAAKYTQEQIEKCVALQYLLNPSPNVEVQAMYWMGRTTNIITWTQVGTDWQLTETILRLGRAIHGRGRYQTGRYRWDCDPSAGWGNLREDLRWKSAKEHYDDLFGATVSACCIPTLGLCMVPPGEIVLHDGKLVNKAWLVPPYGDVSWSMGEFALDRQGRLASIKWRDPNGFKTGPDRYYFYEYSYDDHAQVAPGMPTSWTMRITGEGGPGTPEHTKVLSWKFSAEPEPEKLAPEAVPGIVHRFRRTELGQEELRNGQWTPSVVVPRTPPTNSITPNPPIL